MLVLDMIILGVLLTLIAMPLTAGILGFIEQTVNGENVKASAFD
jgi:hypothetical protein